LAKGSLFNQVAGSRTALTAQQLGELLSLSTVTVFRLAKKGVIPAIRIGSSVRFCPSAVARWLREHGG
jgi:excisionase family DNA binding protein